MERKIEKTAYRQQVIPLGKENLLSAPWLHSREDEELGSFLGRLRGEKLSVGKVSEAVACIAWSLQSRRTLKPDQANIYHVLFACTQSGRPDNLAKSYIFVMLFAHVQN